MIWKRIKQVRCRRGFEQELNMRRVHLRAVTAVGVLILIVPLTLGQSCGTPPLVPPDPNNNEPQPPPPGNVAPTASLQADVTSGQSPLAVTFDISGSRDPDGAILSFSLSFGDGQMFTGSGDELSDDIEHIYEFSGSFAATLSVLDDDGGESAASLEINVTAALTGQTFVVDSTLDEMSLGGAMTLARAAAMATQDPERNLITFDPDVFSSETAGVIFKRENAGSFFLEGEGDVVDATGATVIIDAQDFNYSVVVIRAGGVQITGLTIRATANNAAGFIINVEDGGGEDVLLRRCRVEDGQATGVYVRGLGSSRLVCTETTFANLGSAAVYYENETEAPRAPFPVRVFGNAVTCKTEPGATIELFQDTDVLAGEFIGLVTPTSDGLFTVDGSALPADSVISATSTAPGMSTSTINILAASATTEFSAAILADTGPASEFPEAIDFNESIVRWAGGTTLFYRVANPMGEPWDGEIRTIVESISDFTNGSITASVGFGPFSDAPLGATVIPVNYVPEGSELLQDSGANGFFRSRFTGTGEFIEGEILLSDEPRLGTAPHEILHSLGLRHLCTNGRSLMITQACPHAAGQILIQPQVPTFYDVDATHALYDSRVAPGATLADLQALGLVP